jgi:hypothetical protein
MSTDFQRADTRTGCRGGEKARISVLWRRVTTQISARQRCLHVDIRGAPGRGHFALWHQVQHSRDERVVLRPMLAVDARSTSATRTDPDSRGFGSSAPRACPTRLFRAGPPGGRCLSGRRGVSLRGSERSQLAPAQHKATAVRNGSGRSYPPIAEKWRPTSRPRVHPRAKSATRS